MRKSVIKLIAFFVTFVVTLFVMNRIMNEGHDNLTMEMSQASLPLVTMEMNGVEYNQLHGYTTQMEIALQRDTVTVLGENRNIGFVVDTFGQNVTNIKVEVRNVNGSRLIESTSLEHYEAEDDEIRGEIALKDLIEKDTEYSLTVLLELDGSRTVAYYTRVIWSDKLHVAEKLEYVLDFHKRLYNREAARELTKYLETNASLEDNKSFHKVNIHSSFRQITWDELEVLEVGEPVVNLTEIASQTASIRVSYRVCTREEREYTYYLVEEFYRVRYTADRMYLLDYERTMNQIPNVEKMYANDKLLLGITGTDIPMMESGDGRVVVFVVSNSLFSYNVSTNKLTKIFSFYDKANEDNRTLYNRHAIKILDVDEGGNVQFVVYGYMNRGMREGEVGVQLYSFSSALNTIEELLYIPSNQTYSVLAAQMEQLLYQNRNRKLYLLFENKVHCIDLETRSNSVLIEDVGDEGLMVSDNHKIALWSEGEAAETATVMRIMNLHSDTSVRVRVSAGEVIKPLGFIEEDIIYGVAKTEDIVEENSGRIFFPMYKICICNTAGELLKEYSQDGIYVMDCMVADNQITLERVARGENGQYRETTKDHIMNNMEAKTGDYTIVTAVIDRYKTYVQIKAPKLIDTKTLQVLNPKEVMYEGDREINLAEETVAERYYVYGAYGVEGIYHSPAEAVALAYDISGVVVDKDGECVWLKGNRVTKNQIMAITAASVTEEKNSVAVCLDTIFKFEGLMRNSEQLLEQGKNVMEILEENLANVQVLDLTGCNLDAMLYYLNQDLPVMVLLKNGDAVLVTGFNDSQVVIMEPATGKLYKKSKNESSQWFEENGNCFITYVRK